MEDANQKPKTKNQKSKFGHERCICTPTERQTKKKKRKQKIKKKKLRQSFVLQVDIFFSYIAENTSKKKKD